MSRCHHTEQELEALQAAHAVVLGRMDRCSVCRPTSLAGKTLRRRGSLLELVRKGDVPAKSDNGGCMRANAAQGIVAMQLRCLELDQVRSGHGPPMLNPEGLETASAWVPPGSETGRHSKIGFGIYLCAYLLYLLACGSVKPRAKARPKEGPPRCPGYLHACLWYLTYTTTSKLEPAYLPVRGMLEHALTWFRRRLGATAPGNRTRGLVKPTPKVCDRSGFLVPAAPPINRVIWLYSYLSAIVDDRFNYRDLTKPWISVNSTYLEAQPKALFGYDDEPMNDRHRQLRALSCQSISQPEFKSTHRVRHNTYLNCVTFTENLFPDQNPQYLLESVSEGLALIATNSIPAYLNIKAIIIHKERALYSVGRYYRPGMGVMLYYDDEMPTDYLRVKRVPSIIHPLSP
ncbi:hypothetical protein CIB48_g11353 [Xylaria polymorpha]|nr:hypothetical protein CIB48_g11353 [Xylaria polymorpha]